MSKHVHMFPPYVQILFPQTVLLDQSMSFLGMLPDVVQIDESAIIHFVQEICSSSLEPIKGILSALLQYSKTKNTHFHIKLQAEKVKLFMHRPSYVF